MKKVLFICLLMNGFSLLFSNHYVNAVAPSKLMGTKVKGKYYYMCASKFWTHDCGAFSITAIKMGVLWSKQVCGKIGSIPVKTGNVEVKKPLSPDEHPECIFGN